FAPLSPLGCWANILPFSHCSGSYSVYCFYMVNGPPHFTESTLFPRESGKNCKVYTFSKDGTLFAWGNGEKINNFGPTAG
uniref:Uncharacterized protein n=1 Tax=Neovison vison TaxID=452646 RepID=A0A8C7CED7_NEOVI